MAGGYDDGYANCPCFWGREPGSLVQRLIALAPLSGQRVLDVGCGEGKNAIHLARLGAKVTAVEISALALANAAKAWFDQDLVTWIQQDARAIVLQPESYDVVIMYGLLHCLASVREIDDVVSNMKAATRAAGVHVVCALNDRSQDLSAHPGLHPTLLRHRDYLAFYVDWEILFESDSDLHEVHPHNNVPHTHSLTRILVKKVVSARPQ
jgi:tellurite methyltransferase